MARRSCKGSWFCAGHKIRRLGREKHERLDEVGKLEKYEGGRNGWKRDLEGKITCAITVVQQTKRARKKYGERKGASKVQVLGTWYFAAGHQNASDKTEESKA